MTIFSEIYGIYFRIVSKIMERESVTETEIHEIIKKYGYRETDFLMSDKIIPNKEGTDWGLLKGEKIFHRVTENKPVKIFTELYKRWLKAKLNDPKIYLFLEKDTVKQLNDRLKDVQPLYKTENFRCSDMFSNGDDYYDEEYRKNFRIILSAIKHKTLLNIRFVSGHGKNIYGTFLPLKMEYSLKNDKFRVYCCQIRNGLNSGNGIINISRIESIETDEEPYRKHISMKKYFSSRRCKVPVTVVVTPERNGIERFLTEFSSYEKQTEKDPLSENCTVKIWYDIQDETELLIRLLSFGPVLEIVSPERFRKLAFERIEKQYRLTCAKNK